MMGTITTIDLDIANSVFQVHRIDAAGEVIVRRQIRRARVLGDVEDDCRVNSATDRHGIRGWLIGLLIDRHGLRLSEASIFAGITSIS